MKLTSIPALIATSLFLAACSGIIVWRWYGEMNGFSASASVTVWVIALVCFLLARKLRAARADNMIGQDRSQISPVTAANWLVIGKASAWMGAIVGGAYLGILVFLLTQLSQLEAAVADLPGVIACLVGSILAAAAGIYLERSAHIDPPAHGDGQALPPGTEPGSAHGPGIATPA
ncbi:MAG: DUF3180 domain-containing protein [Corynebacterium sp.]|nr:DUF3180 domain-containing protein [Corynebacterium sp.]